jgi:hypothetical protein
MFGDNINPGVSASVGRVFTPDSLQRTDLANLLSSLGSLLSSLGATLGNVNPQPHNCNVHVPAGSPMPQATANSGSNWTFGSRFATNYDGTVYMLGPALPPYIYKPMNGGTAGGSSSQPSSSQPPASQSPSSQAPSSTAGGVNAGLDGGMLTMLLQLVMELLDLLVNQMNDSDGFDASGAGTTGADIGATLGAG